MQAIQPDTAVRKQFDTLKQGYEKRFAELESRNQELQNKVVEIEAYHKKNYQELYSKYLTVKEQYDLLVYKRFARSAEQLQADTNQQLLFAEEEGQTEAEVEQEEREEIKSYTRKKKGRKPLPENLERRERIIDIPESEKTCACGAKLSRIGEETSEKLQIIPEQIFVEKTVRPKYACRCCEGTEDEQKGAVHIAPVEPSIIAKGIVTSGLLATIITQKFEMHLPYYRQETQFEHIGVHISRQDMSNWQQQAYANLSPLFDLMKQTVKSGPLIQMDETPVQVMGEEERKDNQKSYMWLARGGPPDKKVVWYEYHETRAAYNAKEFLQGYCGYLQTDGYEGYDAAIKDMPSIKHVGCFAHARRKFFEASKATSKPKSAEEGIKYIRKLYNIENEMRVQFSDDKTFVNERKKHAEPVLSDFKNWLLKRYEEVPPTLLLGKAISYTLSQWDKLTAYLESAHLTPDNNACENAIRPFVLGRKNWLFCKSPQGAKSSCGMYTLIETAKLHNVVPFKYLMSVFDKAPNASSPDAWEKLLPWNIFKI